MKLGGGPGLRRKKRKKGMPEMVKGGRAMMEKKGEPDQGTAPRSIPTRSRESNGLEKKQKETWQQAEKRYSRCYGERGPLDQRRKKKKKMAGRHEKVSDRKKKTRLRKKSCAARPTKKTANCPSNGKGEIAPWKRDHGPIPQRKTSPPDAPLDQKKGGSSGCRLEEGTTWATGGKKNSDKKSFHQGSPLTTKNSSCVPGEKKRTVTTKGGVPTSVFDETKQLEGGTRENWSHSTWDQRKLREKAPPKKKKSHHQRKKKGALTSGKVTLTGKKRKGGGSDNGKEKKRGGRPSKRSEFRPEKKEKGGL